MDFYQEQHRYTLAENATIESDSDEETSWVMLNQEGEIVKLPNEKIYYKVRSRIGLEVSTPKTLPNATQFSIKSDSGIVYITNHRVIYLPARPTEEFKSFSAPILHFEDSRISSSFFGPWTWNAVVKPTPGGGIPADVPYVELKLAFREGGHDAFQNKFETMKERLHFARTLQQETGQHVPTGEDLPQYEPPAPAAAATSQPGAGGSTSAGAQNQPTQATPDEPPPDYEEAQAQAVGIRLEERLREEAERQ